MTVGGNQGESGNSAHTEGGVGWRVCVCVCVCVEGGVHQEYREESARGVVGWRVWVWECGGGGDIRKRYRWMVGVGFRGRVCVRDVGVGSNLYSTLLYPTLI